MKQDMTVPCGGGLINLRVGALIVKNGRFLMVRNERSDYLYSVGGRIKMGETAEEAVIREVYEETGARLTVKRLAFVHENYFYGDSPANMGKLIYEVSFFFEMNVPENFEPRAMSFTEDNSREHLFWLTPDTPKTFYPEFFREYALSPITEVRHFVTDERRQK